MTLVWQATAMIGTLAVVATNRSMSLCATLSSNTNTTKALQQWVLNSNRHLPEHWMHAQVKATHGTAT